MAVFSPNANAKGVGTYVVSVDNLNDMFDDLWNTSFIEWIGQRFNGNPNACILNLRYYQGLKPKVSTTAFGASLTVGNAVFNGEPVGGVSSNIRVSPLSSDYAEFDYGQITFEKQYNSYLDYEPFTKIELYLPFVGFVSLPTNEVMGSTIKLHYIINVTSGDGLVKISRLDKLIMQVGFQTGIDIPVNIQSRASAGLAAAYGALKGAQVAANVASAGIAGSIGATTHSAAMASGASKTSSNTGSSSLGHSSGSSISTGALGYGTTSSTHENYSTGSSNSSSKFSRDTSSDTTSYRDFTPVDLCGMVGSIGFKYSPGEVTRSISTPTSLTGELLGIPYAIVQRPRRFADIGKIEGYKVQIYDTIENLKSNDTINGTPSAGGNLATGVEYWGALLKITTVARNSEIDKSPYAKEIYARLKTGVRV